MFKQAQRQQSKLRMTIDGPAGSGKTYTALRFAHSLADGGKIAVIDTERGSASKYVGDAPDGAPWQFDVAELTSFSPETYAQLIEMAARGGYSVLVIDSLSHAWEGKEGALEIKQKIGDSWSAWRHVTPIHNRMVDAILQAPMHVITTMRSRMEYVQEQNAQGKTIIRKVGLSPIQRPGMEYEFDIVADIDYAHILTVSKSRCSAVADMIVEKPGPAFMQPVIEWLTSGSVVTTVTVQAEQQFAQAEKAEQSEAATITPTITLEMLLDAFDPEQILAANGGALPANDDEVMTIAQALGVA